MVWCQTVWNAMTEETPELKPEEEVLPSPIRCWTGTTVAGSMSFAAYLLTSKLITYFATTPATGNNFALRISVTVRTLITGLATMATAVFGMIAIGLLLLGFKSLFAQNDNATIEE